MKIALFLLVVFFCAGCASTFETRKFNAEADADGIKGIVYYEPRLFKVTYIYTGWTGSKGELIGQDGQPVSCRRAVQKEEIIILPDYSRPMVLINKPGWFSSSKVAIGIKDGVLTSINAESASVANEAVKAVGSIAAAGVAAYSAITVADLASELQRKAFMTQGTAAPRAMPQEVACNSEPVIEHMILGSTGLDEAL